MKFIDEAKIYIKAGDGGRGCVSFRREKFVPRGGPNGGNGGKGGDIILRASSRHHTLLDLKYNQHHIAKRGGHGEGSDRTGRNGADVEIVVPVGTEVSDAETGELLCDLTQDGQTCIAARGGIGGKGNAHFATATNRAPRYAQEGMKGEERWLKLELKLLADVGIIGFPNVGKSTLISCISAARPKIADYPFTTLAPHLGAVKQDHESFVVADVPGLIEGAHKGAGLGLKFLKHVERTGLLVHLIDICRSPRSNAWQDYEALNRELSRFSADLLKKKQIVAFSKIDITEVREEAKKQIDMFKKNGIKVFPVSAVTGEGIKQLLKAVSGELKRQGILK